MTISTNPVTVKIGGYDFTLDESMENHYEHSFTNLVADRSDIPGQPGAQNLDATKLLWSWDDWSGGEGAEQFNPSDPTSYYYGTRVNSRNVGQLTGMPDRTQVQVTAMGDNNQRAFLQISQGIVYVACDEKIKQSTDYGATWSAPAGTLGLTAGDNISATTGDHKHFYYAAGDGSTNREIRRLTGTSNSEAVLTRTTTNPATQFIDMCMLNGKLYAWTGRKMFECDVFSTVPLTFNTSYRKVYDTGVEATYSLFESTGQGAWFGGVAPAENALFFFTASEGHTQVYIYKRGKGRPIWNLPQGFTGTSIAVQNGVIYMAGHYGTEGTADGYGAMWALPIKTLQESFIGWFRKKTGTFLQMKGVFNSQGYQLLVAAHKNGKLFVYDAEFNSISLLDDMAATTAASNWTAGQTRIADVVHLGNHRILLFNNPGGSTGTTLETINYTDDEPANAENDAALSLLAESGEWDYDLPYAKKALTNIYVNFKVTDSATTSGLLANQRITVSYSKDGATYTDLTVITSATTPFGLKGRVRLAISTSSSTVTFNRLRLKVTLDNNSQTNIALPTLYSVAAEAAVLEYIERWSLILRVKDESPGSRNARPGTKSRKADVIRDLLEDFVTNQTIVAFLDGYREKETDQYTTHNVLVERIVDLINMNGEGAMRIDLRSVDANA